MKDYFIFFFSIDSLETTLHFAMKDTLTYEVTPTLRKKCQRRRFVPEEPMKELQRISTSYLLRDFFKLMHNLPLNSINDRLIY